MKNQPCHQTWCGGDQETSAADYLQSIEQEFSRIKGRFSALGPLDWSLAAKWESDGIPLAVVLRAMGEVEKNFKDSKIKKPIGSLRYFEKQIELEFAEWLSRQIGKPTDYKIGCDPGSPEGDTAAIVLASSDETDILAHFVSAYDRAHLPEPVASAVLKTKDQLLELLNDAENDVKMSDTAIENRLEAIAADLELSLVVSLPETERARMIERIKLEYAAIRINDESRQKILIKEAYKYFSLPKLTLFEL